MLRQLERWLHQHIFKVGWLVTHSFQTTTILYYTFFLPGVFLHELSYWLVAGMLNVHAKSSIQWPEAQEIAELDLSFVELDRNTHPLKLAIITLAPILTGLIVVWLIANNILDFSSFFGTISSGELDDIGLAVRNLTSTTDFWLWIYFLFVISNTMIPKLTNLKGLHSILIAVGVAAAILIIIGVGEPVVLRALTGPVANALNLLSGTFIVIMCIDALFVVILGTVEALIERVTGHSAMFRRGKLVAMTRQEVIEARQRERRRETRALQRGGLQESSTTSIYTLSFEIPGPPGEEPVTQAETLVIDTPATPALPKQDDRRAPNIITPANRTSRQVSTPALKEPQSEPDSPMQSRTLTPTAFQNPQLNADDEDKVIEPSRPQPGGEANESEDEN